MSESKSNNQKAGWGCAAILLVLLVLGVFDAVWSYGTHGTETITVSRADPVKSEDYYLVWGTKADGTEEVFKVDDDWVRFHFNSSDTFGQLKVGGKYKVEVTGFRIPFMSMYRNIYKLQKAE